VLGLIINYAQGGRRGLAERLNPAALRQLTGVPVLAEIPYLGADPVRALAHPGFDRIADALNDSCPPADL
jgi:hypothetical protein